MRVVTICAVAAAALVLIGCGNTSGLSSRPRATFAQIACLDVNGDNHLNAADAADPSKVPDFNGDRKHDAQDAAFLKGVNIPLDPQRDKSGCDKPSGNAPEYEVAHGYFDPADVSCDNGKKPVLVVGVGGGVVNLRDSGDAAGVRSIVDGLLKAYDDKDIETIAVISGPAITGASELHGSMEQWMTHAVQVYLDRYPCIRALLLGHSHGAVTADVVAAHLEGQYADRIIEVVDVDRVTALYTGDTESRPTQAHVFNIYETNAEGALKGAPYNSANVENWDVSSLKAPKNGDKGGPPAPIDHTNIDNSKEVKQRIIDDAIKRST
jgi:hypothetical protein